jgi:hypothetical protein
MEWNIQARAHACQGCGRAFRDQEPLHTLLYDEHQDYQRLDVCEACWTAQFSDGANHRKGFISHWQGLYAAPPATPPDPIQKDTAETLLRKLVELNDPRHAGACFILAVMLERKRLLKVKAQSLEAGRRTFLYEQPRTGDVFTIPDPNLQLDQLEAVQRDVARLLEHGLNPPAAVEAAVEAAPGPEATSTPGSTPGTVADPAAPGVAPGGPAAGVETSAPSAP